MSTVQIAGQEFGLGNLEHPRGITGAWNVFGESPDAPLILKSAWQPVSLQKFCSPVKNQAQESACNAFTTIECAEGQRRIQGLPFVLLSPGYMYGNINGQQDQGSYLEDAIKRLAAVGTCTAATVPELEWQKGLWPASAAVECPRFRALEWEWCPTTSHVASAIQQGFFCNVGLQWYSGMNAVDGDGWVKPGGRLLGGHSVTACGLVNRAGRWGLLIQNHWTPAYGVKGFAVLPLEVFGQGVGGFWALRQMVDEGGVTPAPVLGA